MQNIMQRSPLLRRTPKADGASPPACWWLQQPRSPWSCTLEASCRCSAEAADGAWVEADAEEAAQGAASAVVGAAEAAQGAASAAVDAAQAASPRSRCSSCASSCSWTARPRRDSRACKPRRARPRAWSSPWWRRPLARLLLSGQKAAPRALIDRCRWKGTCVDG